MKIAVLNLIGNIGKTTVSTNLLFPRLGIEDKDYISVESSNSGAEANGIEVTKFKGREFSEIFGHILESDSALVDVGSSNAEAFLKYMQQYGDAHEEFDYFVIPVSMSADSRVQEESIKTIDSLSVIGVDKKRIRVVFNRVDLEDTKDIQKIFGDIISYAEASKRCIVNPAAVIYENEVFGKMRDNAISLKDIVGDETNYREVRRNATTKEEVNAAIEMIKIQALAKSAVKNFDEVYKALLK